MSEKSDKFKHLRPIYFQPGKLIFHAYGNLRDRPEMIQELMRWANEVASSEWSNKIASSIYVSATDSIDDIFDFNPIDKFDPEKQGPLYESRANIQRRQAEQTDVSIASKVRYEPPPLKIPPPFSLVFADVEKENWPEFSTDSNRRETDDEANAQAKALIELLDLVILLDNRRDEAPVKLEVVSPNWLMSGSIEDPGGTGGPGGRPSPVDDSDTDKYHILPIPANNSALPQSFGKVSEDDAGNDVVVAILDTSYSEKKLKEYHGKWKSHPILNSLLGDSGTNGQLRVHTDLAVESYLPDLEIAGHDYDMTDHGLFVAGIINKLAPKADLHLYQVLNKHGLGDLRSIARALEKVLNKFQGRQLVVNLSLTMNMPLERGHLKANDDLGVGRAILKRRPWWLARLVSKVFNRLFGKELLCCCDSWFERQARSFEWICDLVYTLDARIIAAAGNEARNKNQRPGALYPATFDRVLGVGALADDNVSVVPASYSNLADKPTNMGIATFGGEPGQKKGILGAYVGPFPDGSPNENGWAWWSGTSFATPIVSGITAAVLSDIRATSPGAVMEDAFSVLYGAQELWTPDNEDVLTVAQGPQ